MHTASVSLGGKARGTVCFSSLFYASISSLKGAKKSASAQFVYVFIFCKYMPSEKLKLWFSFKIIASERHFYFVLKCASYNRYSFCGSFKIT